jgi:hypothetical protein
MMAILPEARAIGRGALRSEVQTHQDMRLVGGYALWVGAISIGVWRYLDNDMPSGDAVEALWFGGVAIGVTFHF